MKVRVSADSNSRPQSRIDCKGTKESSHHNRSLRETLGTRENCVLPEKISYLQLPPLLTDRTQRDGQVERGFKLDPYLRITDIADIILKVHAMKMGRAGEDLVQNSAQAASIILQDSRKAVRAVRDHLLNAWG